MVSCLPTQPGVGCRRRPELATHVAEIAETDDLLPPIQILNAQEWRSFVDDKVRTLPGISIEEFERRWHAGEYAEIWDDPDHSDIGYLAMLGGVGR